MSQDIFDQIREKDHAVLTCIRDKEDDTREIREATTLSNRDINYALNKLEGLGLIETKTPEGRVNEIVDGQKRDFKAPRRARLTDAGIEYLTTADREQTRYQEMTHDELVERVRELDQRVASVESAFEVFRQQVLRKLE